MFANTALFKFVQPEKAEEPILVRLAGSFTSVKPVQPEKVAQPISVRLAGNTIVPVNLEQFLKAISPISVRLVQADRSILANFVQPKKAPLPIVVRLAGSFTSVKPVQP